MSDGARVLRKHVERFNSGVRSGDFGPMAAAFADDAEMTFEGVAAGPFHGREGIASAYAERPPDEEIALLAEPTEEGEVVRAPYAWASAPATEAGELRVTRDGERILGLASLSRLADAIFESQRLLLGGPNAGRHARGASLRAPPRSGSSHDRAVLDLALGCQQHEAVGVRADAEHEQLVGIEHADDLPPDELGGAATGHGDGALATPARAEVDGDEQRRRAGARLPVGRDDAPDGELELLELVGAAHAPQVDTVRGRADDPTAPPRTVGATLDSRAFPLRRHLSLLLLAFVALLVAGTASAAGPARPTVAVFFYPWYGTPGIDGAYAHWGQNGLSPPDYVAAAFYPARGPYSSGDPRVLDGQMRELRRAGVDEVVTSWWGWGSSEDVRLPAVLAAARANGLAVAVHLEPYGVRTAAGVADDVVRLRALGILDFYVYNAQATPVADWAAIADLVPPDVRLFAQTGLAGFAAAGRFDGLYTYDTLVYSSFRFARMCEQAHRLGLLCAPSVGPGYDARRAVGDMRVKPRRDGKTYDSMWGAAVRARADLVTITSYNEWHEGSQIEAASVRGAYMDYEGAWGRTGKLAERAYLDRTAFWAQRFRASARPR
jgi:hypothetical protein